MKDPQWQPDFGVTDFIPSWGATAVGARKFLIAYNINLLATKEQAHRIALNIRENGRGEDQVTFESLHFLYKFWKFDLSEKYDPDGIRTRFHEVAFSLALFLMCCANVGACELIW